jgi:hypothetical protein
MVDPLLEDADEGHDEKDDGADMLNDHSRVRHERPEEVRLEAGIALQLLEKRRLIGVVIRI